MLIHGLTGSPPEMRLLGDHLHDRGLTVSAPLLPGHGTTPEDLNRRTRQEWIDHVEGSFADLLARCHAVFVAGLSLGAALCLILAARHPDIRGAVLYSPPLKVRDWRVFLLPVARHFLHQVPKPVDPSSPEVSQRCWCYDMRPLSASHQAVKLCAEVARLLPQVACPLLVMYGALDAEIHPSSAQFTYDRAGSRDKALVTLQNSGHAITVDREWEEVAERTYAFIWGHLPGDMPGSARPLAA